MCWEKTAIVITGMLLGQLANSDRQLNQSISSQKSFSYYQVAGEFFNIRYLILNIVTSEKKNFYKYVVI